ncbi:hypothetical protein D3C84_1001310 [compost metagenome]
MHLLHHPCTTGYLRELGQGRAQPLGILLRENRRQPQFSGHLQKPTCPGNHPLGIGHGGNEFFLNINDQQGGVVYIDEHGLILGLR